MMCLSQTSGYAVHALSCLHHQHGHTSFVRDIAKQTGIPKPYLAKIINSLNHHGLVYAKRGYRGGIALARPPEQISLLQVVEAIEGRHWIADCMWGIEDCVARNICPTHKGWQKVRKQIKDMLRSASLADAAPFSKLKGHHEKHRGGGRKATQKACCQSRGCK